MKQTVAKAIGKTEFGPSVWNDNPTKNSSLGTTAADTVFSSVGFSNVKPLHLVVSEREDDEVTSEFTVVELSATIGRDIGADIRIKSKIASRFHAEVSWNRDIWVIRSLNSANGLKLDGELIREATPISEGSVISIGEIRIVASIAPPPLFARTNRAISVCSGGKPLKPPSRNLHFHFLIESAIVCAFRGDPATYSDSIRPPVPI